MRKFISIALVGVLSFAISYGAVSKVAKGEIKTHRFEPAPSEHSVLGQGSSKIIMPNTRNGGYFALVDSSTNGYGMVATVTRPFDVNSNGDMLVVYRQYAGENTTHGQLGAAYSEDGMDWTNYNYLNVGFDWPPSNRQARYPSALGNPDYPYAFWNEYTTLSGSYGGRPYYTYDEFGWDGGSFAEPINIDLQWGGDTDQWVGSPGISFDGDNSVVNVAYNDWTRNYYYMYNYQNCLNMS